MEHKCHAVQTLERPIVVDEMRSAAKEFCQFAGAPQELFALVGCEVV